MDEGKDRLQKSVVLSIVVPFYRYDVIIINYIKRVTLSLKRILMTIQ